MKKRILAAVVCSAMVLSITACGKSEEPVSGISNQTEISSSETGGTSNPTTANDSGIWDDIPEIPMTDADAFKYAYNADMKGMVITDYLRESPKVRIPDKLEDEPVVGVDLSSCEKQLTQLVLPDSVIQMSLSRTTENSLTYLGLPADGMDYNVAVKYDPDYFGKMAADEFYEEFMENVCVNFSNYKNLVAIGVSEKCPRFTSVDGMLFYEYNGVKKLLVCPQGKSGSVTIPDNVTEIRAHAFDGCENLNAKFKNKTYDDIEELTGVINFGENYSVIKSKVTSADKGARNLCTEISAWFADNIALGGSLPSKTELGIICVNGTATITNDIAPAPRNNTIKERIEEDFPTATFAANVYLDSSGYAYACVFCDGASVVPSNVPGAADFNNGTFHWKSTYETGILPTGEIVGTYPKLSHRD